MLQDWKCMPCQLRDRDTLRSSNRVLLLPAIPPRQWYSHGEPIHPVTILPTIRNIQLFLCCFHTAFGKLCHCYRPHGKPEAVF